MWPPRVPHGPRITSCRLGAGKVGEIWKGRDMVIIEDIIDIHVPASEHSYFVAS
jgi:hypothetical protein